MKRSQKRSVSLVRSETTASIDVRQLVDMFNAGRYSELEAKAHTLTAQYPSSGIAWKCLSVALIMQGKDALQAAQTTTMLLPDDAEAQNNLGNALQGLGKLEEAAASYRRALQLKPHYVEAHSNLGNTLHRLGKLDEAEICCRRALQINPDFAEAHSNLGNALRGQGQLEEAIACYRRAIDCKSNFADAHNNLGSALLELGQVDAALACSSRALQINPGYLAAHVNLGIALTGLGKLDEAVASFDRALQIDPNFADAHNGLGNALLDLDQPDAAVAAYQRAIQIKSSYVAAHVNLSIALKRLGSIEEAEASCRRALDLKPDMAMATVILGSLYADRGQFTEAEMMYRRAISFNPALPEAWSGIAAVRKMTSSDVAWLAEAQRLARQPLLPRQEAQLLHAIGKYFDDVRDFDQAFTYYQSANELTRLCGVRHDRQRVTQAIDQIIQFYDRAWVGRAKIDASTSERPVFIVGMPRSGTTLAEQILASHPQVFGAGELTYWTTSAARYLTSTHDGLTSEEGILESLANEYLRLLQELSADAVRVIDKMPGNFQHLGLIHAAFPQARIIHMRRNPIDTCLSIYFQNFTIGQTYANDLGDLAHYYGEYQRVMEHWSLTLPVESMLEVPYEGLVEDQETWSRTMLEFIGLPWDVRCLDFHQTSRTVLTASGWQVRQKVSQSSVARWRNYESYIGPLLSLKELGARA